MARKIIPPTVVARADDPKKGMTFKEIREWVQNAMQYDVPDDVIPHIDATWRSSIKSISAQGEITNESVQTD